MLVDDRDSPLTLSYATTDHAGLGTSRIVGAFWGLGLVNHGVSHGCLSGRARMDGYAAAWPVTLTLPSILATRKKKPSSEQPSALGVPTKRPRPWKVPLPFASA